MSYASVRFTSTLLTAAVGAVLGVAAFSLPAATVRWLAFGTGCAVLIVVALAFLVPRRGGLQRILDLPTVLLGVWLIASSRGIESAGAGASPGAIKWLNLAAGAALCALGGIGLLLHEAGIERDLRRLADGPWSLRAVRADDDGAPASREAHARRASSLITAHHEDALSRTAGR
jgi:hypothetical protein